MWSYLHCISSPELEADCLQTRCLDSDRSEPSSATTTAVECYSTDKLTAAYLDSLFGMTPVRSEPTTRQPETISTDCVKSATDSVSVADSPVKILARQEKRQALPAHAPGYGKNMPVLLARLDPLTCTWKTPPTLLGEGLTLSAQTYPAWGIILRGELYPLRALERGIYDADFGVLQCETIPTPTMHNHKQAVTPATLNLNSLDLTNYCNVYPTACIGGTGSVQRLRSLKHLTDAEKKSLVSGNGGKLNPDWVEWLMGWQIGWTRLQPGAFGTRKSTDSQDCQSSATTANND